MTTPETKTCPRCEAEKPSFSFYKNRARADGLDCICKDCRRAASRRTYRKKTPGYRQRYISRTQPSPTTRICTNCTRRKPVSQFDKSSSSSDGYASWCKTCKKDYERLRKSFSRGSTYDDFYDAERDRLEEKDRQATYYQTRKHELSEYGRHLTQWERKTLRHLENSFSSSLEEFTSTLYTKKRYTCALCNAIPSRLLSRLGTENPAP